MPKTSKPRKHGSRWRINYLDGTGKRRWESFTTHKAAAQALRQRQAEADAVRVGSVVLVETDHTFAELAELWAEVKYRKRTLRDDECRIRLHLTPSFGKLRLIEITPRRIARLERDLSRRMKVGTIRQVLSLLRGMLNVAVEHNWLARAPKIRLPSEEERPYRWIHSEAEMRRFLLAAQDNGYPGLVPFYATALYTGMRAGELCGLRWSDVDFANRLLTVQHSFTEPTKTNAVRRVPILNPLLPVLKGWKLEGTHPEQVFVNKRGNMHVQNARVMKQLFHGCLEAAGLEAMRFHDLRHTFASHWMLKGGDLFRLQKILGHKSIAMTQRYAHLAPEAFQQDWGRFGDVVPKQPTEALALRPASQTPEPVRELLKRA